MADETQDALAAYAWEPQPAAAGLIGEMLGRFTAANQDIAQFARLLQEDTGTRLIDWVDTIVVTDNERTRERLRSAGFESNTGAYRHAGGLFPQVVLADNQGAVGNNDVDSLAIRVDSIDDFSAAWPFDGEPTLVAVERHGCRSASRRGATGGQISAAEEHLRLLVKRQRDFDDAAQGLQHAADLFEAAAEATDRSWACDVFFAAERRYWMSRNHAARVQYARQQQLGLGWGNHDHHTYRSSRACFHRLIAVLERLGFACRERFYAGHEAGWGAQVLEQPQCGLVVFADVDLSAEEITGDIAHLPLPPRDELGTVGLWCALHGESFLQAGLHHVECQFDFDAAREQLAASGVETMAPFTDFPHLRQAFTQGEIWPVDSGRIDDILAAGQITSEQAEQFRRDGAIGSHLEILERNDGYKGFNQTGVSDIIARTDPRKWQA